MEMIHSETFHGSGRHLSKRHGPNPAGRPTTQPISCCPDRPDGPTNQGTSRPRGALPILWGLWGPWVLGGIALVALTALVTGPGCKPDIREGWFTCDPADPSACPDGWVCRPDPESQTNRCYSTEGSAFCGDGKIQEGEQCDGANLGDSTCVSMGHASGFVICTSDCKLDATNCRNSLCGDGTLDPAEECDQSQFRNDLPSCQDRGTQSGTLTCGTDCRESAAACVAASTCGNGLREEAEQCDGTDLGTATCSSNGFAAGTLKCNANCTFNFEACEPTVCGDGTADDGIAITEWEPCDGTDLRGLTCSSFGFSDGTLGCTSTCRFDLSDCQAPPNCGNLVREGVEQCDGQDMGNLSCASLGFAGGSVSCNTNCSVDTSQCR